ncbi:Tyrosine kinase family catalytic domain containing protein [Ceratobasidium theobromae]|uniref:Tyrosine kinase family catalytic domain containing protein n=1 Tax=Ceratobasidium theobromae TaxID=1582974 RepID=A0A5N5QNP7_9AGAM|nr:Tyrosine kinase family catalytic domain containing protein [Ceratobasidium theobromae]
MTVPTMSNTNSPKPTPAPPLLDDTILPIHQHEEACIPGTRQYVFDVIYKWFNATNLSASKVLFLADISGSGKSAVARHVAYTTSLQRRLLGSFFFRRDIRAQASASGVISSLAHEIATLGGEIAREIVNGAKASKDAGYIEAFHAQITVPLNRHPPREPSLILIDALDESSLLNRADFLKALTHEIPLLPPMVKVMLTSKPSQDIEDALNKLSTVASDDDDELEVHRLTFDVYGQENRKDLRRYISHSFGRIAQLERARGISLPELWPSNQQRQSLAAHANGLFLWVSVAADYVANSSNPELALEQLLALQNRPSPEAAIDALYKHILHVAEANRSFDLETYYEVLQAVLVAPNPLTVEEINAAIGLDASATIACLRPVLGSDLIVRFVHQSFRQYVRDPQKCETRFLIPQGTPELGNTQTPESPPINPPKRRQDSFEGTLYTHFPLPSLATIATYPHAQHVAPDVSGQIDDRSLSSRPVASGAFGDIWRARHWDGRELAIKSLRFYGSLNSFSRHQLERSSAKELLIWSKLQHPNVLKLLGICVISGEIGMVSEWMPNGNVTEYVFNHPEADRLKLIVGVAAGLSYLHSKGIVHGDLKGLNVVVAKDETVKLVDFGLTKLTEETIGISVTATSARVGGTARWMARELIDHEEGLDAVVTFESDVYALGMTILEILTGCPPFAEMRNDMQVISAVLMGRLPRRPPAEDAPQLSDELWELMNGCWDQDRNARPSASQVLETVRTMSQQIDS